MAAICAPAARAVPLTLPFPPSLLLPLFPQNGVCWPNDDSVWNCTLKFSEVPTSSTSSSSETPRLFRLNYDAGRNVFAGNCGVGQLTQLGEEQQFYNGQMLRELYISQGGLLPSDYSPASMYIRADDVPRTIQSAQSLFHGLYPPASGTTATEIVDMHIQDKLYDDIMPNGQVNPTWTKYESEYKQQPSFKQHTTDVTDPLVARIKTLTGTTGDVDFMSVWDCYNAHVCHGMQIPSGLNNETFYNEVAAEQCWESQAELTYPNVQQNAQVGAGYLVRDMVKPLAAAQQGNEGDLRLTLVSGHDWSIIPLLQALQLWDVSVAGSWTTGWTPYASAVHFELYENTETSAMYVRVVYNGKTLTVPGCPDALCPWDAFETVVAAVTPTQA